jgi:hypothetical protein
MRGKPTPNAKPKKTADKNNNAQKTWRVRTQEHS